MTCYVTFSGPSASGVTVSASDCSYAMVAALDAWSGAPSHDGSVYFPYGLPLTAGQYFRYTKNGVADYDYTMSYVGETNPATSGGGTGGTGGTGAQTVQVQVDFLPQLSAADGSLIGGAIALVWALGWCFRALKNAIAEDERENS